VVCSAHDAARLCDWFCQFFSGCSSWGLISPLAPDKPRLCLPLYSSPRFLSPPFLFFSFSFLAKLTRCLAYTLRHVHCSVQPGSVHLSRSIAYVRYVWKLKFRTIVESCYSVYLQCIPRDSHCYFSAICLKSWGTVPPLQKVGSTYVYPGTYTPVRYPESYAYVFNYQGWDPVLSSRVAMNNIRLPLIALLHRLKKWIASVEEDCQQMNISVRYLKLGDWPIRQTK